MRTLFIAIILTTFSSPTFGADSVFAEGAWNGSWSAKFPPFINFLIGPVTFNQIPDALGPARMDALRTPGTAAANCPGSGERTEYYEGIYNYNNRGQHVACTNGEHFFVVYRDDSGPDRGVMLITTTFPDERPPRFIGTYTTDGQPTGNIEGFYQGGGIATPLARVGDGGGDSDFTGCRFSPRNGHLNPHHPLLYSSTGRKYLGLEPLSVNVLALEAGQPVDEGTAIRVTASSQAFSGDDGMPSASERTVGTNEDGRAAFPINPPTPTPSETIVFTANLTIGGEGYECTGTIVTGISARFLPYLGKAEEAIAEVERSETAGDRLRPEEPSQGQEVLAETPRSPRRPPEQPFTRLPLIFEENQGQGGSTAKFIAKTFRGELRIAPARIAIPSKGVGPGPAFDLEFIGGDPNAAVSVVERLRGRSHYLIGSDPELWVHGAAHAAKIRFASVYPGIDVVYYGNRQQLEYDFEVAPEADPDQIRMRVAAPAEPVVTGLGDLVVDDGERTIRLHKPIVYQDGDEGRTLIAANYRIDVRGDVGFEIGPYDRERPLIIDPILETSTFLGGGGEDVVADVTLDSQGNIYLTGATSSSGLATEQALKKAYQGGGVGQSDGFIAKLDPTGTRLLFLTYIGGRKDDSPIGIAVDSQGSVLVTGATTSEDFPTVAAFQSQLASHSPLGGADAFVLKLDSTGSTLVYSTYLGGRALELGGKIDVDAQGNAYVVGGTTADDFPTVNAFQPARGSAGFDTDAFAAKLSPAGEPVYVTYLGGSASDWGFGVAADDSGSAWIVGMTDSQDFPVANALQTELGGGFDVFAAKLSADGQTLQTSGFLGGSSGENPSDAAVDSQGNLYVTGATGSNDFPLAGAAQAEFGSDDGMAQDAFVAKISSTGTELLYSTYLGGSGTDIGNGIAVGPDGSAYVAGETNSANLPLASASQAFNAGSFDGFIAKLSPSGGQLEYSTYLGGSSHDTVSELAVDSAGRVVAAGVAYSPDFSVTLGSLQPDSMGGPDGFVARLTPGVPPPAVLSLSAASFERVHGLAPDSFATAFGSNLATQLLIDGDMPTTLGTTTVSIVDADGESHAARLYIVSPTQINYLIPPEVAPGLARLTVNHGGQVVAVETIRISAVAPGLFSAASSGAGVAAAVFLRVDSSGNRTDGLTFDSSLAPVPLDLGAAGTEVYVFLFGTGMRNSSGPVTVTIDGIPIPFAGPVAQGQFDGLDQLNLGPLPRTLAGRGEVEVIVSIDGKQVNTVTLSLN